MEGNAEAPVPSRILPGVDLEGRRGARGRARRNVHYKIVQ